MKKWIWLVVLGVLAFGLRYAKADDHIYGTPSTTFGTPQPLSVPGALQVAGQTTFSGRAVISNLMVFTPTSIGSGEGAAGIFVTTTVPVTTSFENLISSGGIVTLTSTPSISTTTVSGGLALPEGTWLVLTSTAQSPNAIVLQDDGTLNGSLLQLGSTSRTISQYKTITLILDKNGYWVEKSYGNN